MVHSRVQQQRRSGLDAPPTLSIPDFPAPRDAHLNRSRGQSADKKLFTISKVSLCATYKQYKPKGIRFIHLSIDHIISPALESIGHTDDTKQCSYVCKHVGPEIIDALNEIMNCFMDLGSARAATTSSLGILSRKKGMVESTEGFTSKVFHDMPWNGLKWSLADQEALDFLAVNVGALRSAMERLKATADSESKFMMERPTKVLQLVVIKEESSQAYIGW
ncbi:MAG: hypothetical protein Q9202_004144 [Teloschistes flavicans]